MAENKTKGFRFYFDKDLQYLINEELVINSNLYLATRSAKRRLRQYANLFTRDMRKTHINTDTLCVFCASSQNLVIDHIIPIAKGGTNTLSNIQVLCAPCNQTKRAK